MLTKYSDRTYTYYADENGVMQGEYVTYWGDGGLKQQGFVKDDLYHGERVCYDMDGTVISRAVYCNDEVIVSDATDLTDEDRFELSLKYDNLRWILQER